MIEITHKPILTERLVNAVKTSGSGCVVTYLGLIRNNSRGRKVASVTYQDSDGSAVKKLESIVHEVKKRWTIENIAITHRIGKLLVNDINLAVAVAASHRIEGFAACQYIIDEFKRSLPTKKTEVFEDSKSE